MLLIFTPACSAAAAALTPGASADAAGGVVVRRSIQSCWRTGCGWVDITSQVASTLPPLPAALCHMHADDATFALVDGGLLDALSDGDANRAAMPATGRPTCSASMVPI